MLGGVALTNERSELFRVTPGELKAMHRHMTELPSAHVTQTGWNAYSRIDAVEGFESPYLARLYIDSDAWTNVLQWDGDLEGVRDYSTWYRALPFKLVKQPETLIIGPGGGSDVLVALASGSKKVTAVELNPLMLKFVRHYGARAGNLYDRPDVEVMQSEGRNVHQPRPTGASTSSCWASSIRGRRSLRAGCRSRRTTCTRRRRFAATTTT